MSGIALVACTATINAGPADGGPADGGRADGGPADGAACGTQEVLQRLAPGCGNVATACRSTLDDACAMDFCGCDGKTFIGRCGWTEIPYVSTGPCPADGGLDADGGKCGVQEVLERTEPGCGVVATKCRSTLDDACTTLFCGCDGVTFAGRCGWTEKPFVSRGPCPDDGGADASGD